MDSGELSALVSHLKGDPVPWLLEDSNPCVRYRALRELLGRPADDAQVRSTVEAIWAYPPVAGLLSALAEVKQFPQGTVWSMSLFKRNLGDLDTLYRFGIPGSHPAIRRACQQWLDVELTPLAECYPKQMVAGLTRYVDSDDPRLQEKVRFVIANEPLVDGNRPGVLRYGARDCCCGSHSCHMAVAKALWAVVGLPEDKRTPEAQGFMDRGARFLAAHRLYQSSHREGKPIAKAWLDLHLPFAMGCDTDILDLLDIGTQVGLAADECIADALDVLLSKQNSEGRWRVEASGRWVPDQGRLAGHVATVEARGEQSKWITLGALIVLKRCERFLAGDRRTDLRNEGDLDGGGVLSRYRFDYYPCDESRVRSEWTALGMELVLEQLLTMARERALQMGWHWGYVMGPGACPEWCAATARWIPRRGFSKSWPVCRIHFLSHAGQFSENGLSEALRIPVVDEDEKPRLKKVFWPHLWRIRVQKWRDGYDEVAVTLRDVQEAIRLRPIMECALREFLPGKVHENGQQPRAADADKPRG